MIDDKLVATQQHAVLPVEFGRPERVATTPGMYWKGLPEKPKS